jgi:hypothetical protein
MHPESGGSNCRLTMTETHPNKYEKRLKERKKIHKTFFGISAFQKKKEKKEKR